MSPSSPTNRARDRSAPGSAQGSRLGSALGIVVAMATVLAAVDVGLGAVRWDDGDSLRPFAAPHAVAVVAAGASALAVTLAAALLHRPLRLSFAGAVLAGQIALAAVWSAAVLGLDAQGWLDPGVLAATLPLGLAGGWMAGRAMRGRLADLATWALALAGWSWIALGLVWLGTRPGGASALGGVLAVGVAGAAALGLAVLVRRRAARRSLWGAIVAMLVASLALGGGDLRAGGAGEAARDGERLRAGADGSPTIPGRIGRIQRVVLVVVDTLRRDALSCYSPGAGPTPHVDRLARDGVVFRQARSAAPWTLPAMASVLSGLGSDVHLTTQPGQRLPAEVPTLAEEFGAAGYRTGAIGENSILRRPSGLTQGFDEYDWYPRFAPAPPLGAWLAERLFGRRAKHHLIADELTDRAIAWLDRHADEPTFLWLHYFDPHVPYAPPDDYMPSGPAPSTELARGFFDLREVRLGHVVPNAAEKAWIRACYRGEVRFFDAEFGRLLAHLEERGWYDDTLIVFTSDHGEEFWEHNGFEHGHAVWEEVLGVPLIVKLPGQALRKDVDVPVSTESIGPTIQALCGLEGAERWTSPPLFARSSFDVTAAQRTLVSLGMLYYEERLAILDDGTKYVLFPDLGREELYELSRDPAERVDRSFERPDEIERFRALWGDRERRAAELRGHYGIEGAETVELDAADAAELRALGYVR